MTELNENIIPSNTVLTEDDDIKQPQVTADKKREPGSLKGKVSLPGDFNEPLEDLKDYM